VHDKKYKRCNESKRVSYPTRFDPCSTDQWSSSGGIRKRTHKENACTLDIYGNRKLRLFSKLLSFMCAWSVISYLVLLSNYSCQQD